MAWVVWNGDRANSELSKAVSQGLMDAGNAIKEQSDAEVPHDGGTLQKSGLVKANPENPLEVKIGYGGGPGTGFPEVPYTYKWHELKEYTTGRVFTNVNFQKGRKWKYLRDPLMRSPRTVIRALQRRLRQTF